MKLNLNLASRRYVNRRAVKRTYLLLVAALLVLSWGTLSQYLESSKQLQGTRERLAEIERDIRIQRGERPMTLDAEGLERLREEFALAEQLLARDAFRWTALFDRMEKLLPKRVSLRGFQPDYKQNTLTLSGVAQEIKDLQKFLDRLLGSGAFEQVYLHRHAWAKKRDESGAEQQVLNFSIRLEGVF